MPPRLLPPGRLLLLPGFPARFPIVLFPPILTLPSPLLLERPFPSASSVPGFPPPRSGPLGLRISTCRPLLRAPPPPSPPLALPSPTLPRLAKGQISRGNQQRQTRSSDFIIVVNLPLQFLPQGSKPARLELRTATEAQPGLPFPLEASPGPLSLPPSRSPLPSFPGRGSGSRFCSSISFPAAQPTAVLPFSFKLWPSLQLQVTWFLPPIPLCHPLPVPASRLPAPAILHPFLASPGLLFLTSGAPLSLKHQEEAGDGRRHSGPSRPVVELGKGWAERKRAATGAPGP